MFSVGNFSSVAIINVANANIVWTTQFNDYSTIPISIFISGDTRAPNEGWAQSISIAGSVLYLVLNLFYRSRIIGLLRLIQIVIGMVKKI